MCEVFRNVGAGPVVHRLTLTHAPRGGTKMDIEDIDVFIGIDVGKAEHWATALSQGGQKVLDRPLPNLDLSLVG